MRSSYLKLSLLQHQTAVYKLVTIYRYRVCNTDPCAINEPTFREVQCSKHNNMSYKTKTINEWIPYFDQGNAENLFIHKSIFGIFR